MTDEQKQQIQEIIGADNQFLIFGKNEKASIISNGEWFPKSKFDEVNNANKELKSQIDSFTQEIGKLKESAKDSAELTLKMTEMQNKLSENETKYQESLINTKKRYALDKALFENGLKDEDIRNDIISSRFNDFSKVEIDESGKLKDMTIIDPVKEKYKSVFVETVLEGAGGLEPNNPKDTGGIYTKAQLETMPHNELVKNYDKVEKSLLVLDKQQ